jgi:hypothetical protein
MKKIVLVVYLMVEGFFNMNKEDYRSFDPERDFTRAMMELEELENSGLGVDKAKEVLFKKRLKQINCYRFKKHQIIPSEKK